MRQQLWDHLALLRSDCCEVAWLTFIHLCTESTCDMQRVIKWNQAAPAVAATTWPAVDQLREWAAKGAVGNLEGEGQETEDIMTPAQS